jgi:hypothetical protein
MQPGTQDSFKSIISSSEHIYNLAKSLDTVGLEKELPEYTKIIEQYFLGLDKEALTRTDFESLKRVMSTHEKIVNLINAEKEKITTNLKQLHAGKEMQNTYPKPAS